MAGLIRRLVSRRKDSEDPRNSTRREEDACSSLGGVTWEQGKAGPRSGAAGSVQKERYDPQARLGTEETGTREKPPPQAQSGSQAILFEKEVPQHPGQGDALYFEDPIGSGRESRVSRASVEEGEYEGDDMAKAQSGRTRARTCPISQDGAFHEAGDPPFTRPLHVGLHSPPATYGDSGEGEYVPDAEQRAGETSPGSQQGGEGMFITSP